MPHANDSMEARLIDVNDDRADRDRGADCQSANAICGGGGQPWNAPKEALGVCQRPRLRHELQRQGNARDVCNESVDLANADG
jgi:hypothetical protein